MFAWLGSHIGAILIVAVLAVAVLAAILSIVKDKRAGRSHCGCGCAHCSLSCGSRAQEKKKD